MKNLYEQNREDEMRKDPDNYKWGIFYFNPKDSRIILPKRNAGMGWTFNFAHPVSSVLLFGIILLGVVISYFS